MVINKSQPTEPLSSNLPPGPANFIREEQGQVAWDTEGIWDRLANGPAVFSNTFWFLFSPPLWLDPSKNLSMELAAISQEAQD